MARARSILGAMCDALIVGVDCVVVAAGPALATLAWCLIGFVAFECFADVLPRVAAQRGWLHAQALTLVGLWLLGNLIFNYGMAMFLSPGDTPSELTAAQEAALVADPELEPGKAYRFCKRCNKPKPMRAHHCSICKRCVLKMDHHCPWINNCVGHRNHRHFLLFLFYMSAASGFFLLCDVDMSSRALAGGRSLPFRLVLSVVLAFSALIATGLFQLWSYYLLATNQSTIEFYGRAMPNAPRGFKGNPYHLGLKRNLKEVFGHDATFWSWLLPSRRHPGDGVTFPLSLTYAASQQPDWDRPDSADTDMVLL